MPSVNARCIVLFVDSLVAAGAQRQIVLLAKELKNSGYSPHVLIYHRITSLQPELDARAIPVTVISRAELGTIRFVWRLYRFFRDLSPVAAIAYLHMPSILTRILGRLAGVPVIITSERSLALHRGRFSRWLEPLSRKLSTFVVTNTWAGKESLLRASSVPERKISVIYNGLDGDEFCPAADSARARARSNFDIAADVFAIVLPGRIVWEKNHECLLRAAARAELGTPFSIMFFGQELDTTLKKRLELLAEELRISESVRFCGAVSEMAEVYALADVVVLPSLTEALPNVVIEAMASGRIVAATDISDNRRLMEDGVSGFLFPNNDHDALARVLELISRLPDASRAAIQGAARSRILDLCSKERMGASFIALVEAGAGRSSSGAAATGRSSKINARSRTDAVTELEDAEVP